MPFAAAVIRGLEILAAQQDIPTSALGVYAEDQYFLADGPPPDESPWALELEGLGWKYVVPDEIWELFM
jgi:hypothetical protein